MRGEVGVVDGTERQAVGPTAAEVGDVDVLHEEDTKIYYVHYFSVKLPLLLSPLFKQAYKQMCKSSLLWQLGPYLNWFFKFSVNKRAS